MKRTTTYTGTPGGGTLDIQVIGAEVSDLRRLQWELSHMEEMMRQFQLQELTEKFTRQQWRGMSAG